MSFTTTRPRSQSEQVQQLHCSGQADMQACQIVAAVPTSMVDLYCQASLLSWSSLADALKRFDEARTHTNVPPGLLVDRGEEAIKRRRAGALGLGRKPGGAGKQRQRLAFYRRAFPTAQVGDRPGAFANIKTELKQLLATQDRP